jgi:small multidrug resistance pump
MTGVLLGAAILSEVAGTLALRESDGFSKPVPTIVVAVGYILAFVLLAQVLSRGMPVGIAYAIWAGCGVALVAVLGKLLWDDPLPPIALLGIVLIIGGVILVETATAER